MKNILKTLCVLTCLSVALSSCLNSDDETNTAVYDDMAITGITLGTLNRYTHTLSSYTGNDTIVKTTLTGSAYGMTIDQLNHTIYNHDVLPSGTDLKHVVLSSISTKNNSIATLKSPTSDSIMVITTGDSIDFSSPRIFRVYSSKLDSWRDYTMTLTSNPAAGIAFAWRMTATIAEIAATGLSGKHLVTFGDSIRLVDGGVVVINDMKNGDAAYRLNGQSVERSTDLENWTTVVAGEPHPALQRLVGAGTRELFALGMDGKMMHSSDNGVTWQDETLDDDAALLPVKDMATTAWDYLPVDSADYVLMVGNDGDNHIRVWRKISQYGGPTKGGQWVYMEGFTGLDGLQRTAADATADASEQMPSMACYGDVVLAVGSKKTVYESVNQGLTWYKSKTYALPSALTGEQVLLGSAREMLWLLTDSGEVWQGALR